MKERIKQIENQLVAIKEKAFTKGVILTTQENQLLELIFAYGLGQSDKIAKVAIKRNIV